jgi:hypothetical protein
MNQNEIRELAHEAGFNWGYIKEEGLVDGMTAFAKLVAQYEREGCIKACEQVTADLKNYASAFEGITAETKFVRNIGGIVGEPFIDAIKARGQA